MNVIVHKIPGAMLPSNSWPISKISRLRAGGTGICRQSVPRKTVEKATAPPVAGRLPSNPVIRVDPKPRLWKGVSVPWTVLCSVFADTGSGQAPASIEVVEFQTIKDRSFSSRGARRMEGSLPISRGKGPPGTDRLLGERGSTGFSSKPLFSAGLTPAREQLGWRATSQKPNLYAEF